MAELEYRKLSQDEIDAGLSDLAGWTLEEGLLAKTFTFESYKAGLVFAVAAGYLADAMDHHPDLLVGYRKVRVSMSTHAVKGLSPYDFALARRIESL